ncbi:hypothetical protein [Chitinophaga filiformis]|uniref:Uncharacterized protein n=1 Tax=Chitinophaga filiformis TaxID=104663 RepID=A0A1G7YXA1_CHIFI|nr:hypothetical protein [Chitinophaga filiformis]SDH00886.1 hypothetical protein SAMN04488121_10835 [Chitinophaga filiformis]
MAKIPCTCGNRIIDISDNLPTKGAIIPNQLYDDLQGKLDEIVIGLKKHRENKEILTFNGRPIPANATDEDIIGITFFSYHGSISKEIWQCNACGRILIWHKGKERFIFFSPDSEGSENILSKDT